MTWEEYCIKKKIDSSAFEKADLALWTDLKTTFEQVHPNSFTEQKKFLINDLRRKYLLQQEPVEHKKTENIAPANKTAVIAKPIIKKKDA